MHSCLTFFFTNAWKIKSRALCELCCRIGREWVAIGGKCKYLYEACGETNGRWLVDWSSFLKSSWTPLKIDTVLDVTNPTCICCFCSIQEDGRCHEKAQGCWCAYQLCLLTIGLWKYHWHHELPTGNGIMKQSRNFMSHWHLLRWTRNPPLGKISHYHSLFLCILSAFSMDVTKMQFYVFLLSLLEFLMQSLVSRFCSYDVMPSSCSQKNVTYLV